MIRLVRVCFILICVLVTTAGGGGTAQAHVYSPTARSILIRDEPSSSATLQAVNNPGQFLPVLMNNINGWISVIYVLNVSSGVRTFSMNLYASSTGGYLNNITCTMNSMQSCIFPLNNVQFIAPGSGFVGIAANANQDLAIHSNLKKAGEVSNYSAFGDAAAGNATGVGTGVTIYAPSVKNLYGGRSTNLYIQNTADFPVFIKVETWDNTGAAIVYNLPAIGGRALAIVPASAICASGRICSARVSSTDGYSRLAGIALELNPSTGLEYALNEMFSNSGAQVLWLPLVKYQYGDPANSMTSGFRVQNLGSTDITISLDFLQASGFSCSTGSGMVIHPAQAITLTPNPCLSPNSIASGVLAVTSGFYFPTIAVTANETSVTGTSKKKAYSGISQRGPTLYAPLIYNMTIQGLLWKSGITIDCASSTSLTLSYFDVAGNQVASNTVSYPIFPFVITPPDNFQGSMRVSNEALVFDDCGGVVNTSNNFLNADTQGLYTMVSR